ncbi:tetratricopeptide repeat protein [Pendulispora albinea]|uniref:Tetratricopeptide repeat protein n=1 Tax=Pendulispora albinea TaxID=2741071 RepID=A0ABZ2MAH6_9BACT
MSPRMEEARTRYSRGLKLYDEGNIIAARVEFERAYELAPSYRILYNIGLCYKKQNDYVEALKAFERYLSDGGDEVPEERRVAVNKEIQDLRPNIATVTISTNIPGASITVDDVPVGQTPLSQKVLVNPGRRRIAASKSGMFPATKSVVFAGSDVQTVSLELVDLPKAATETREEPHKVPYWAWGITGGLAAGAIVTGVLALKANSDQNALVEREDSSRPDIDSARDKTKAFSIAADVLTASAVIMGGISLYLTLHKSEKSTTTARLTPGGVSLVGQF